MPGMDLMIDCSDCSILLGCVKARGRMIDDIKVAVTFKRFPRSSEIVSCCRVHS